VAVASAGPYASLHLALDSTPPLTGWISFLPTNSAKALKAVSNLKFVKVAEQ